MNLPIFFLKYILILFLLFIMFASPKKYYSLKSSSNITVDIFRKKFYKKNFYDLDAEYYLKIKETKVNLWKKRIKSMIVFSKELDIGIIDGINHGLFRIYTTLDKTINIEDKYVTEYYIDKTIINIHKHFKNGRSLCIEKMKTKHKLHDIFLYYQYKNPKRYQCLIEKLNNICKFFDGKQKEVRCWDNCEIFFKNIIQRYLRSVCEEQPENSENKKYCECCKETISHYIAGSSLKDISMEEILDFNNVQNCVNPDPNRTHVEILNVDSELIDIPCAGFCKPYDNTNNMKDSVDISEIDKMEIEKILDASEQDCILKTHFFFNFYTILGFILSICISVLLFYFRL